MSGPPLSVGTPNAAPYLQVGMGILRGGGRALDAVEQVIREVEMDLAEHSVGVGGLPNLVGEVELDASIMDGRDRSSGSVGAVRGYPHPISIARRVMERTPHVFLTGEGAEYFARETGFATAQTLTPEAKKVWEERLRRNVPPEDMPLLLARRKLLPYVLLARDPERTHGTVNVLALDNRGDLASGVSTSGWAWKYPGRLGDSPVIGAGNYCDNRFGAAACTGHGELAIRSSLARTVVMHLEYGASVEAACERALADVPPPASPELSVLVVLAVDRDGRHCCRTNSDRGWGYAFLAGTMSQARSLPPVRSSPR